MADRSGTEPATARSPLRLRMVLAVFGIAVCGLVAVLAWSWRDEGEASALTAVAAFAVAGAALAAVDLLVVVRRWRAGRP